MCYSRSFPSSESFLRVSFGSSSRRGSGSSSASFLDGFSQISPRVTPEVLQKISAKVPLRVPPEFLLGILPEVLQGLPLGIPPKVLVEVCSKIPLSFATNSPRSSSRSVDILKVSPQVSLRISPEVQFFKE